MTSSTEFNGGTLFDLQEVISAVDRTPRPATYAQAARDIGRFDSHLTPVRVALLFSFTIDMLRPYLAVELARHRLGTRLYIAPFNTVAQELLDPESGCARHDPEVVFVAWRLADLCPALADDFLSLTDGEVERFVADVTESTVKMLEVFRSRSTAALVVHTFNLPREPLLGIGEISAASSQSSAIRDLNHRLAERAKQIPGVYVLDAERAAAAVGYRRWYDDKLWHLGRAPLSAEALLEVARTHAAFVQAILGRQAKCLVVDLDGTLWGGVVGEVGVGGIALGSNFPGSIYRDFQRMLLALHQRGVLLAINSKNNLEDVERVFDEHPETVLRREHFAARRINWQDKPQNMRELAAELNIGLDALVFVDDNPAERALMRQALPEVRTLELPGDPLGYGVALSQSRAFDRLSLSNEDRHRTQIYKAQAERQALQASAGSLEGFLESLDMRATIAPASQETLPRVLDLVQKTNQFNLTTRRHSAAALAQMAAEPGCGIFTMRLVDRFGDQGIVGVAIVDAHGATAHLDTLILSCRVIGRNVETALLSWLAEWSVARGATAIEGELIHTPKNVPARDFFAKHGFTRIDPGVDATRSCWRLSLGSALPTRPAYIVYDTVKEWAPHEVEPA